MVDARASEQSSRDLPGDGARLGDVGLLPALTAAGYSGSVVGWYRTYLISTGRSPALWAVVGFVVAYGITRWATRRIRARQRDGSGRIKDVYIGGVHVHHQVWGILLALIVGLLEFRYRPESPGADILALLFGVGAALALDEFALWLHLEDVYWTEEGRKSIDAVLVAVVVGIAVLISASPVGVDTNATGEIGYASVAAIVIIQLALAVMCLLKGKLATGLIGLPIPFVALVGAVRTAKPASFWARRFYGARKMARAESRFDESYRARHERVRDLFSGGHW